MKKDFKKKALDKTGDNIKVKLLNEIIQANINKYLMFFDFKFIMYGIVKKRKIKR